MPYIQIKASNTVVTHWHDSMLHALPIIAETYHEFFDQWPVISGAAEAGFHGGGDPEKSRHYGSPQSWKLQAVDVLIPEGHRGFSASRFAATLRGRLGAAYQLVVEPTHLHVEFDPSWRWYRD